MSTGKIILSLVVGAAAGAVLGVLLAPDKGANTRKKISQIGEDYLSTLSGKVEDVLMSATNEFEYVKSEAENLMDKGKEKLQAAKNGIQQETPSKI